MNRFGAPSPENSFKPQHGLPFPNYNEKTPTKPPPAQNINPANLFSSSNNSGSQGFSGGAQNSALNALFASNNQAGQNQFPSQAPPQSNQALSLSSYVPPAQFNNNFYNPQTNYNPIDFLKNPNLTDEQRDHIVHLSVLNKAGFFAQGQGPNSMPQAGGSSASVSSHFTLKPEDLQTAIEHEVPKAQKIKEQVDFRRSSNQNELTYYTAKISDANMQANLLIPEVNKALMNLQKFQGIINQLAGQISMAQDRSQTTELQSQMQQASKGVNDNMSYIRNSQSQVSGLQRGADQDFSIVKNIVGQNSFGNIDYELASKAAYDLYLANETIKNLTKTAETVYVNTQTGTQNFNQGNNSLCFIKTGQQFWKSNPNEIIPNLLNMPTQTGRPLSVVNISRNDSDPVHSNGRFGCGKCLLQETLSEL